MYVANDAPERARWAVMWIYVDKRGKRKVYRKDFKDDIASAEELYHKALKAGKPYATLACVNMGFPPPVPLRPRTELKRARDRRTGKKRIVRVPVEPLKELNTQGTLWCPYCRAQRRFVLRKVGDVGGIRITYPRYACPICGAPHKDYNVRKWNPHAAIHMDSAIASQAGAPRGRSVSKSRRRRRRARA